jgi:hypothetical protein
MQVRMCIGLLRHILLVIVGYTRINLNSYALIESLRWIRIKNKILCQIALGLVYFMRFAKKILVTSKFVAHA